MARYANPEVLVESNWVKENLGKPGIKLIEIDVDTKALQPRIVCFRQDYLRCRGCDFLFVLVW